jgi:MSHA pilin protein MshC
VKPISPVSRSGSAGFTLVELTVVIILIGVLAAVTAVKLTSYNAFDLHVAAERLRSDLAKAQLLAVANAAQVRLAKISDENGAQRYQVEECPGGSSCSVWPISTNPSTAQPFKVTLPAGIQLVTSTFYFNTWGIPTVSGGASASSAQALTLRRGAEQVTVNVRPVTGSSYVVR